MSNQSVLPRRSRRLAAIIPASHWISFGYSLENAYRLENLQNDMKAYCEDNDNNQIELLGRNVEHEPLPHNDMMLPHWQKFAIGLKRRTSVEEVQILGISLPVSVLDIIFPALQSLSLKDVTLFNTGLGNEGFQCLSAFLKDNRSLKELFIAGDTIDDMSVASSLSDAVKDHPCLKVVGFVKCGLNNVAILEVILEGCKGKDMGLGNNNFGSEEAGTLSDFIHSNNSTEVLNLNGNKLTDNDALVLASALRKNTHLDELILTKNDMTEEGQKALMNAVFDPTAMDSIVECNHRCLPYTYDINRERSQRSLMEQELISINADKDMSVQQKIRQKVILALCGVDGGLFDLSHLNDLPLQLMPRLLALVQGHTFVRNRAVRRVPVQLEKDALTRLFHTLRGWELPLLFGNLHGSCASSTTGKRKRKARGTGKRSCRR